MKKALILFLLFVVPLSVFAYYNGDIDGNGNVETLDFLILRRYFIKERELSSEEFKRSDVNGDGVVNPADYNMIMRILIKKEPLTTTKPTTTSSTSSSKIEVTDINIKEKAIYVKVNNTYKLDSTITPNDATNKKVTYKSDNDKIATVNADGVVTGKKQGNVTITATASNGLEDRVSISVGEKERKDLVVTYESDTLHYYIERFEKHMITHIWVDDPYNQIKVAISAKDSNNTTVYKNEEGEFYPRSLQSPSVMMRNYIRSKKYQDKGLIAINASGPIGAVSEKGYTFNEKLSKMGMRGTGSIGYILNDEIVIRNSVLDVDNTIDDDGTIKTISQYFSSKPVYGINEDGYLVYFKFKGAIKKGDDAYEYNKKLIKKTENCDETDVDDCAISKAKVRYTFGFTPVLVYESKKMYSGTKHDIHQAVCQVDKNNFIIVTNITGNRTEGYSLGGLADKMLDMNCMTGFNTDGGGSTNFYYKNTRGEEVTNTGTETPSDGRRLADMLYFVEK